MVTNATWCKFDPCQIELFTGTCVGPTSYSNNSPARNYHDTKYNIYIFHVTIRGLHTLVNDVWDEWGIDNHYRDYAEHYEENPDEVPDVCVANSDGTFSHTYHLEDGTIELGSYRASAEHGLNSHTERAHDETWSGAKYTIVLPQ